jgi:tetratricopeptide (TPR) repeat protein
MITIHAGEAAFRDALKLLEAANRFNPNNADLNWMIAYCKFSLNSQSDESLQYFDKAYKLNPMYMLSLPIMQAGQITCLQNGMKQ